MWKDSTGHDQTHLNRFGDAKADLDSFLENPFYHDKGEMKSLQFQALILFYCIFYFQACVSTF